MKRAGRMAFLVAPFIVAAACSTYGEVLPDVGGGDDGGDASVDRVTDALSDVPALDAGACDLLAPWQDIVPLTVLNSASDDLSPRLTADELTLTFASSRSGNADIFVATRSDKSLPFGAPTLLGGGVNTVGEIEGYPALTGNGLTLYYQSKRFPGAVEDRIYRATRASTLQPFGTGAIVPELAPPSDTEYDITPFVSTDGTRLYFASNRGRTSIDDFDIYEATMQSDGGFATPVFLATANQSPHRDEMPVITADGLTLYLSSWRDDPPPTGNLDIYRAVRLTTNDPFSVPVRIPELSTPSYESPGWVSPDGCRLYFMSNRPFDGGSGDLDIYLARKPPL